MDADKVKRYIQGVFNNFDDETAQSLRTFEMRLKAENVGPVTRFNYLTALKKFILWGLKNGWGGLESLDADLARRFLSEVKHPNSRCLYAIGLKRYFKTMGMEEDYHALKTPRQPKKSLPEVLTEEEILRMAEVSDNLRNRAIILFTYETGARIHEIRAVRIRDITFDQYGGRVIIHSNKSEDRPLRLILSAASLQAWLDHHKDRDNPDAYIFYGYNARISEAGFRKILRKAARKADIRKRVTPHILRHSRFARLKQERKLTDEMLKKMGGWRSRKMLDRYGKVTMVEVEEAYIEMYGLEREKPRKESVLQPKPCPRCQSMNPTLAKHCNQCGLILDEKEAAEVNMKQQLLDRFVKWLAKPGNYQKFMKQLEE